MSDYYPNSFSDLELRVYKALLAAGWPPDQIESQVPVAADQ